MLVDATVLVAALMIAVAANRYWTIYLAVLQTIIVFAHAAKQMDEFILPTVYYLMTAYMIYPIMTLLAVGAWRHQRRKKIQGVDDAWKQSLRLWTRGLPRLALTNL